MTDELAVEESSDSKDLLILFGTETGNAEALADEAAEKANKMGFTTKISNMLDIELSALKSVVNLLVIVSTWGDGEPPDDALDLYESLDSDSAPLLSQLKYSVLALGDTSYEYFCRSGKDFDTRLEKLGATRIYDRKDCDVDFDDDFEEWSNGALNALAS